MADYNGPFGHDTFSGGRGATFRPGLAGIAVQCSADSKSTGKLNPRLGDRFFAVPHARALRIETNTRRGDTRVTFINMESAQTAGATSVGWCHLFNRT